MTELNESRQPRLHTFPLLPLLMIGFSVATLVTACRQGTSGPPAAPVKSAARPSTAAEIAFYQGPDRQQILVEGARREGQLTFYTSNTWMKTVAEEFEKKYPFIKVAVWRSDTVEIWTKVLEEFASGRVVADVIENTFEPLPQFRQKGVLQEFYSPELANYGEDLKLKGPAGVDYWADREIYLGLGFNTNLIHPADAPRTLVDLLNPKWKGKISIAGSTTGVRFVGIAMNTMGRDYIQRLAAQDVKVHNISGAALANLIVSGEVPLSPTIFNSNVITAQEKGAPIEWRPLEPVIASVAYSGTASKAPHPCATLP